MRGTQSRRPSIDNSAGITKLMMRGRSSDDAGNDANATRCVGWRQRLLVSESTLHQQGTANVCGTGGGHTADQYPVRSLLSWQRPPTRRPLYLNRPTLSRSLLLVPSIFAPAFFLALNHLLGRLNNLGSTTWCASDGRQHGGCPLKRCTCLSLELCVPLATLEPVSWMISVSTSILFQQRRWDVFGWFVQRGFRSLVEILWLQGGLSSVTRRVPMTLI